jgi:hypothetical protein
MRLLSTQGGIRAEDGSPIALGYHTGHYEVGLLMQEAAFELKARGAIPFAGFCSDPCDGRTQSTTLGCRVWRLRSSQQTDPLELEPRLSWASR